MSPGQEEERIADAVSKAIKVLSGRQVFQAFDEALREEVFPGLPPEAVRKKLEEVVRSGDLNALVESIRGLEQRVKAVVGTAFFHGVLRRVGGRGPLN